MFIARHGYGHTIPPHEVNYRANIWALHSQGVKDVVAVNSVGGIHARLAPGVIAIPDQILDYTYGRKHTFFEGADRPVMHVDFTHPYCETLRARCIAAAKRSRIELESDGVYAAVQGPRLETKAEIDRLERDGATMVGMTGMPEAGLAREMELCYAAITVVANHAAGRGASSEKIELAAIYSVLEEGMAKVRHILEALVTE